MRFRTQLAVGATVLAAIVLTAGAEDTAEWRPLFDGVSLNGWEQKNGHALYRVEDGAIVGTSVKGTPNSFLCTQEHFGDFVLEFEFKGHPRLNSGVQFRSHSLPEYKNGRVHGYQCELEDEDNERCWSGGIYDEGRAGWLCPTKADKELGQRFTEQGARLWKKGEWNRVRIRAVGASIQTWVNGALRADFTHDVAASGFMGLQVHSCAESGLELRWRNLRIQVLDSEGGQL